MAGDDRGRVVGNWRRLIASEIAEAPGAPFPPRIMAELVRSARPASIPRGGALFRSGHPFVSCFLLLKGAVKLSISASQGQERTVALHGPGSLVGALGLLDGQAHSSTAVALSDCYVLSIQGAAFADLRERHPEMERQIVVLLARKLREASDTAAWAGLLNARQRIANALLQFARLMGRDVGAGLMLLDGVTHAEVAALAYVSREEVTRVIASWKRAGAAEAAARPGLVVDLPLLVSEAADGAA